MAAAGKTFNSQTRIYGKLSAADTTAANLLVGLINTGAATDAATAWAAVETFVGTAEEIGDETLELTSFIGEPQSEQVFPYNGSTQGVSRPLPSAGQTWTFTIDEYDRSNSFHKSLEDGTGKQMKMDIAAITISDDMSVADTTMATARCASGVLNVARVPYGAGNERQSLEVTMEIESTVIADQA